MSRAFYLLLGILVLIVGLFALVVRWQAAHFSPALVMLGLLAFVGVPGAVWLALGKAVGGTPRRLPRIFWIGLSLVVLGLAAAQPWFAVTSSHGPVPLTAYSGARDLPTLRPVTLPGPVEGAFRTTFPRLQMGRAFAAVGGPTTLYEVWLRRPGESGYALEATWSNGMISIENQVYNTDYIARAGRPLTIGAIAAMYRVPRGTLGPIVFPGYVLYLKPASGQGWAVDRLTGQIVTGMGW